MGEAPSARTLLVGIVVGEASGDILGAGLIKAIKALHPDAVFEGIGGPLMIAEGCQSLFPQDRLAVMGFVEPLKRLPELLHIRRTLRKHFLRRLPDVFIGVDSPDFNLNLEKKLREQGIKTVHYVSPSVWAWRQGRIKTIAKAVDRMLTLFPFEQDFYDSHGVDAVCVGHTLADAIPLNPDKRSAQDKLNLQIGDQQHRYIAVMPGSRQGEVYRMLPVFLAAAQQIHRQHSDVQFIIAAANESRLRQINQILEDYANLPIQVFLKQSHQVMQASDLVLLASGTTALEAMLLKKPMVIAYKVAAFSYFIFSRMVKVPFIGLPNLLAKKMLAKELIQHDATAENISQEILRLLAVENSAELIDEYVNLHHMLRKDADRAAARAVLELCQ